MSDQAPRYHITDLASMVQIPTDRLDAFLADLKMTILLSRAKQDMADAVASQIDSDLRITYTLTEMFWEDDGTGDLITAGSRIPACAVDSIITRTHLAAKHIREGK